MRRCFPPPVAGGRYWGGDGCLARFSAAISISSPYYRRIDVMRWFVPKKSNEETLRDERALLEVLRDLRREHQHHHHYSRRSSSAHTPDSVDGDGDGDGLLPSACLDDIRHANTTKSVFNAFVDHAIGENQYNPVAIVPGAKGSGRTTLLHQTGRWLKERFATSTFLYVPKVDVSDPALNLYASRNTAVCSDGHFPGVIQLQFLILHAATGAPPTTSAFAKTVREIRERVGVEVGREIDRDVVIGAVRTILDVGPCDHLLLAIDDDDGGGEPVPKDEHQQLQRYPISLPPEGAVAAHTIRDLFYLASYTYVPPTTEPLVNDGIVLILAVTPSIFKGDYYSCQDVFRLTLPPVNPYPYIAAVQRRLSLSNDAPRMAEVRYMLQKATIHARFLADIYAELCGESDCESSTTAAPALASPLTVTNFDARFAEFVNDRIHEFMRYCKEKDLDPRDVFHYFSLRQMRRGILYDDYTFTGGPSQCIRGHLLGIACGGSR